MLDSENETAAPSAIGGGGKENTSGCLPYHHPVPVARQAAGEAILRDIAGREAARWPQHPPRIEPHFGPSFEALDYDMGWVPLQWQGRIVSRAIESWPIPWLRRLAEVATDLVKRKEGGG